MFLLYFALLSFISFLAVSNHHGGYGRLGRGGIGIGRQFQVYRNGSSSMFFDPHRMQDLFNPNSFNGSKSYGLLAIQKTGNVRFPSRIRDPAFATDLVRSQTIFKCAPVHFREQPGPTVALVSFPGSGNTWIRYLLQLSTGIFTGSVYKDFALLRNGFPGESLTNGRVLVVKTHESGAGARSQFQKAILLVRKPAEAILAEFNRRAAGHIGHAGYWTYTRNAGKYWSSFVSQKGKSWTETNLDWIEGFQGPLFITMYHQLVQNTSQELTKMLDFLGEPVNATVLNCVLNNKEGIYRRRKKTSHFNPYTPKMEKFLALQERTVYNAIQRRMRKESGLRTTTTTSTTIPLTATGRTTLLKLNNEQSPTKLYDLNKDERKRDRNNGTSYMVH